MLISLYPLGSVISHKIMISTGRPLYNEFSEFIKFSPTRKAFDGRPRFAKEFVF
ncbi:MAG: hypothetical protein XD57_1294, partial [Thermotoga petrophila]